MDRLCYVYAINLYQHMKKRKLLLGAFALSLTLILGSLAVKITQKWQEKKTIQETRQLIPALSLADMQGNSVSLKKLVEQQPGLFILFNPDCHFCQMEAEEMQEKAQEFSRIEVCFISTAPRKEIKDFAAVYALDHLKNIRFLQDSTDALATAVGANTVPFMLLYDKDQRLINTYQGSIKLDLILKDAKEHSKTGS